MAQLRQNAGTTRPRKTSGPKLNNKRIYGAILKAKIIINMISCMIFKTKSPKETQKIAADIARKIVKSKPQKHACVFALEGELGAGKTTFIQGFAKALKIKQKITSPTFVLMRHYKLRTGNPEKASGVKPRGGHATLRGPLGFTGWKLLIHIDAFRLKNWHDLISLGIKDIFANPENIVLIEWAERVRPILPQKRTRIHIDHLEKNARKITITEK